MYQPKNLKHINGLDIVTRIDMPMLARFINAMTIYLQDNVKLCFIGGSAMTLLGLKNQGSEDIDILLINRTSEIEHAINQVVRNWKHVTIQIQHEQKTRSYVFNPHTEIQTFSHGRLSMRSMGYLRLPSDFEKYMKRIHVVEWVMPNNGHIKNVSVNKVFRHIHVYTLGLHDLVCTKIFNPREKDQADLGVIFHELPVSMRFFSWKRKELVNRFMDFVRANQHNKELVRTGINQYNTIRKLYGAYLDPLPDTIGKFI